MKIEELVLKEWSNLGYPVTADGIVKLCERFLAAYTEQQEPVAIVVGDPKGSFGALLIGLPAGTDLYAAPVVPADMVLMDAVRKYGSTMTNQEIVAMIAAGEVKL